MALHGELSLFQQALRRLSRMGSEPPLISTTEACGFMVLEQCGQSGMAPGEIIIEPEPRNTAPAILAAALHIRVRKPEALMLVLPSDHYFPPESEEALIDALETAVAEAANGRIVTIGIRPDRPETGYGYLELDQATAGNGAQPLRRFVEKPDRETAARMLESGRYLWNAGIFLFSASTICEAFGRHAPDMLKLVREALQEARREANFLKLAPAPWKKVPNISIDYAIMEKADNLSVVPFDGGWSDLGDWAAVNRLMPKDERGNSLSPNALALSCRDTMIRAEAENIQVVGIGLRDLLVLATPDAVLVADKERSQEVGLAVRQLRATGVEQAMSHRHHCRPWGSFEYLGRGNNFQVKKIIVQPGGILSLQSHRHRAEHWIVVEGRALVTVGNERRILEKDQSVHIPKGARHRLENIDASSPLVLIEILTGEYLGDDDIVRYEDAYDRK